LWTWRESLTARVTFWVTSVDYGTVTSTDNGTQFYDYTDVRDACSPRYSVVVDVARHSDSAATLWVTSADYGVGDTMRLYDSAFTFSGDVTITSVGSALPNRHYKPPINRSVVMPSKTLSPEPATWCVEKSLIGRQYSSSCN